MSNPDDGIMTPPPMMKRGRHSESENKEKKDRLSDLPDGILLHILSFMKAEHAVRTCILSKRWKDLWKYLPTLLLNTFEFSTLKSFTKFVSRLLSLRDGSAALHTLDFDRRGCVEAQLLKRIINYAVSHNVQRLGISVECDIHQIPPRVFSCQTLTSLKLSLFPKTGTQRKTLFPKSLNLPALTTLYLQHFTFSASANDRAEPFSAFNRLNILIIHNCALSDAQILCISSKRLVKLTMYNGYPRDFYKFELSTPSLQTFAFKGTPNQLLCGRNLSSVKQLDIDVDMSLSKEPPLIILSFLLQLTHIKSLTISASTLRVLFLIPDLLKAKLPFLGNLKSLKVRLRPLSDTLSSILIAAESGKAGSKPSSPVPDGMVDFLLQNSPSAEVGMIKRSW